jgi:FkbM family methyltransferase
MLKRVVPSIRKRIARFMWPSGRGIVRRDGVFYLVDVNSRNYYDKYILHSGVQEPDQRAFLLKNIVEKKCDTFIDIGANYGLYAASVALQTDCATIHAFEPGQRSYDRLRANLLINNLTERVKTHQMAISDHTGVVQFTIGPDDNDFTAKVDVNSHNGYSVPSTRLDDALQIAGRRIALKIDIEGHERAALDGMRSLLRSNECFLQIECWKENASAFIAAMEAERYVLLHRIDDDHYFERAQNKIDCQN